MIKAGLALGVALAPAAVVWWRGRRLLQDLDSPTLAEQWWQQRILLAQLVGAASVVLALLHGWMVFWLAPLVAAAALIAGFPARRAVLSESWGVTAYMSWILRLTLVFAGLWIVLLITPAVIASVGAANPWIVASSAVLLAVLLGLPHRWLVAALGAAAMTEGEQPELHSFAREMAARSTTPPPRLFRLDLAGGNWANALAIADTRSSAVVMSSALLELLDVPERCAIYAHELAHLEYYSPNRLRRTAAAMWVLGALAVTVGPISLAIFGDTWPGILGWVLLLFLILVWRTHNHQRNEAASDLRALELCENAPALVSALEKLHAASRMPRRLAADDERRQTHPSLARRIQAIRHAAGIDEAKKVEPESAAPPDGDVTIAAVAGGGGRYVLLEATRISWLEGVSPEAVGYPERMRAAARSSRSLPYDEVSELRIGRRRNGAPELIVRDLRHRRSAISLSEADAAAMQRGLDRVDGLLAVPAPPSLVSRTGASTAVARVAAALLVLNSMFVPGGPAIAVLALVAAIIPRASWLLAASTAAFGGLLFARLSPVASYFVVDGSLSVMHAIVGAEALLLATIGIARALTANADHGRWAWLTPALLTVGSLGVWGILVAGTWLLNDGSLDLYRLNRWVNGAEVLFLYPVAAATTVLAAAPRRRWWLAVIPLLMLLPALWIGGEDFRNRHAHDPFIASAPPHEVARSISPERLWEGELPGSANHFRLAPTGMLLAFSSSRTQQGVKNVPWAILDGGAEGERFIAVDLGFAAVDEVVAVVADDNGSRIASRPNEGAWSARLPTLDHLELMINAPLAQWAVRGHRETASGQELLHFSGTIGGDAVATTRIAIDDQYFWPGSVTWLGAAGVMQQCLADHDEPDESTPWRLWLSGSPTRLVFRSPHGSVELPTSRLTAIQCAAGALGDDDALCLANDDDRVHLWRITARRPTHPIHLATVPGRFATMTVMGARWIAIATLDRTLLVDRTNADLFALDLGSQQQPGSVAAVSRDAIAVSFRSAGSHRIAVYRLR